jgi:hypothetical protein
MAGALVAGLILAGTAQAGAIARVPLTYAQLQDMGLDWTRKHEGYPMGVPAGYDWYAKPVKHWWNDPRGFLATTGWGQVFYLNGAKASTNVVQIRNFQTLMCYGSPHKWVLLQKGNVDGGQYRADFSNNTSVAPALFVKTDAETTVGFAQNGAFHFWPVMGRATIPDPKTVCGVVVLMEARVALPPTTSTTTAQALLDAQLANQIKPDTYLIGAGVDYWTTKTAGWDNYKTNGDLGIGRLKLVTKDWAWVGLSSASDADALLLFQSGYDMGNFK